MITSTQIFANYLDKKEIRYTIEAEDVLAVEVNGMENAQKIRVVFIFDEDEQSVAIRCFSVAKVPSDKLARAYEMCSKLNNNWRWVKFYIDSDNEVTVADDAVVEPTTLGEECLELLAKCIRIVDKAYPEIMATVWGFNTSVSAPQKR